jgi:IS5 family transposase
MRHELAQLAGKIDWDFIDGEITPLYSAVVGLELRHGL